MNLLKSLSTCCLLLASFNSFAFLGLGSTSWKEEILLHDGSKIIVKRSQSYGGSHEIGQSPPVKEHTIKFEIPGSRKELVWTSEYGEDIRRTNFNLLALHVKNGTPYLVVEPNLCLAYNKWGRPNPPYLIFKHDSNTWQRIQLAELPAELKTINLIVNNGREEDIGKAAQKFGYVSPEDTQHINNSLGQPEYRSILRESLPQERVDRECPPRIFYKGGWISPEEDSVGRRLMDKIGK